MGLVNESGSCIKRMNIFIGSVGDLLEGLVAELYEMKSEAKRLQI